jgi:hypothetical protein
LHLRPASTAGSDWRTPQPNPFSPAIPEGDLDPLLAQLANCSIQLPVSFSQTITLIDQLNWMSIRTSNGSFHPEVIQAWMEHTSATRTYRVGSNVHEAAHSYLAPFS